MKPDAIEGIAPVLRCEGCLTTTLNEVRTR